MESSEVKFTMTWELNVHLPEVWELTISSNEGLYRFDSMSAAAESDVFDIKLEIELNAFRQFLIHRNKYFNLLK